MFKKFLPFALLLTMSLSLLGEDLQKPLVVKSKTYYKIVSEGKPNLVGESIYFSEPVLVKTAPVGIIRVDSEASRVDIIATDAKQNPVTVTKLDDAVYEIAQQGRFWIDITAIDFKKGIYEREKIVLDVGEGPTPTPPGPTPPGPTPDGAPIDAPGLHVMFVYETDGSAPLTLEQSNILFGDESSKFLREATGDNWRVFDQHVKFDDATDKWAKALVRPRASVPWVVISNSDAGTGFEGPLPSNLNEFRGMLEIYRTTKAAEPLPTYIETPVKFDKELFHITMYSSPNCIWCERWKQDVKPFLPKCVYVERSNGNQRVYPTFKIEVNGKSVVVSGYQSLKNIEQIVRRLRNS